MNVHVHIGIPTLDGKPHQECVLGLLEAWGCLSCSVSFIRGPLISRNRDIVVADFLAREDATHVLFVDSDIAWKASDLVALLALEISFAFGRYVGKVPPYPYLDKPCERGGGFARCGGGFVLVEREAIERMIEAYGEIYTDPMGRSLHGLWRHDGASEGEDFAFCRRWREIGGTIATSSDCRLGHVGSMVYRPNQ